MKNLLWKLLYWVLETEMHIKIILEYHFLPIKLAKFKNLITYYFDKDVGGKNALINCGRNINWHNLYLRHGSTYWVHTWTWQFYSSNVSYILILMQKENIVDNLSVNLYIPNMHKNYLNYDIFIYKLLLCNC